MKLEIEIREKTSRYRNCLCVWVCSMCPYPTATIFVVRYVRTVRSSSNADVIDIINNVYMCLGCAAVAASYSIKYWHWNKNKYRCHRLLILPYLEAHTFRWAITSVHNKQRKTIFSNEIENYWIWYWWALQYQFHFKLFTCTQRKFTYKYTRFVCMPELPFCKLALAPYYCLCCTRVRSHAHTLQLLLSHTTENPFSQLVLPY